jgi:DNA adenine methylase
VEGVTQAILIHHGSKWLIGKKIVEYFPKHKIYVEPFCGSCSVLFSKEKSFVEVVNDTDDVIVNIFKSLRDKPLELMAMLWATPYAKANFKFESDNDIERACLAIAKAKQFYVGNQSTSTFSIDANATAHRPKSDVWSDWHERVIPAASRLKSVQILNEDALIVIRKFKMQPEALIYIDPPYLGHEQEYRFKIDYGSLVKECEDAVAKIIVSEFPEGSDRWPSTWSRVEIRTIGRSGAGAHRKTKKNREILIANYDLQQKPPSGRIAGKPGEEK